MGCDIHPYPEKLVDGEWVVAEPFVLSKWWYERIVDEDPEFKELDNNSVVKKMKAMSYHDIMNQYGNDSRLIVDGPWDNNCDLSGSNSCWFAILAGVRNECDVEPINEERGLPDDVSPEVKRESDYIDADGHSHSWVTLQELLDYDWDGLILHDEGTVNKTEFLRYKIDGYPYIWSISVGDDDVVCITNEQMGQICLGIYGLLDKNKNYCTKIKWDQSYRDAVGPPYLKDILDKLAEYGEPDEVRLVFWFDN